MNDYIQGRKFIKALDKADLMGVEMSAKDWAVATGLLQDFGHGYVFEDFTEEQAISKIESVARAYAEDEE